MAFIYPGGDEQQTLNLGLATWGMDEVLAQNMILIDAFAAGPFGSAVRINGAVISNPNFVNSATVTFSVVGSNVSATAAAGSSAWANLTGDLTETQVIPWDGPTPGTPDSGISRLGPASLAIGNGTTGDHTGTLKLTNITMSSPNGRTILQFQRDAGDEIFDIYHYVNAAVLAVYDGTAGSDVYNLYNGNLYLYQGVWVGTLAFGAQQSASFVNLTSGGVLAWQTPASVTLDTGISRLGAASLAIGNGTARDTSGNLSYNRVNLAGADYAGTVTITAAATTQSVTYAANYTGTAAPVVVATPTSDPLALGAPVGYWVTPTGGAGAWTGFTMNIQTALAGNVTFNYMVIGKA
jgi:hypothetical protein